jgi:hypothetical protein
MTYELAETNQIMIGKLAETIRSYRLKLSGTNSSVSKQKPINHLYDLIGFC